MRKMYLKACTSLFLLLFTHVSLLGADYYWVGGSGIWSDFANHWATSSGGTTFHTLIPTSSDNVIFDANSFTAPGQVVTVDQTIVNCLNMNWTGVLHMPTFASNDPTNDIKIHASLTLSSDMILTFNGILSFEGGTAGNTVSSNGISFPCQVQFNGVGGEWILQDAFHTTRTLLLNHGTLRTNDQPLTCAQFSSYNTNTRSLYLGTSTITINGGSHGWFFLAGGLTLDADESYIVLEARTFYGVGGTYDVVEFIDPNERGSVNDENVIIRKLIFGGDGELGCYNSQIDSIITVGNLSYNRYGNSFGYVEVSGNFEIDGYSGNVTDSLFVGGNGLIREGSNSFGLARFQGNLSIDPLGSSTPTNQTFGDCFIGGDGNILSDNSFDTLRLSPGKTYTLGAGTTQTITDSLEANGDCISLINLLSSNPTQQAQISKSGGTETVNGVILQGIGAVGGASFIANNSLDNGNNSGWVISPPISRTYYWVGGSGNWSNPANWSLSSGGATAGCVPSAVDDVIFDSNSFSSGSNVVTVDIATAFCKNMDWSSAGFNPVLASNSTSNLLKVYGSLTLNPTMSLTFNGSLLFESVSAGQTITSAGQVLACEVRFNGVGGEWILQDEFHTTRTLLLNHGTLRTNDQPLTCAQFSSYNTNTRSLYLGTSTITIDGGSHGWFFLAGGLTLDADESYIVLEARTFYGVGGTYDVVEFIDPNERGSVNDENVIIRKLIFGGDGELGCYNSQIDSIITVGNLSYNRYGNSFGYVEVSGNFEIDGYSGNVTDSLFVGGNGLIREGSNSFGLARFQGNLSIDPLGSSTPTNQTFGDCFIGGDGNILSDNSFDTLRLSPGKTYTLGAGTTQTITDSLEANGDCISLINLLSSNPTQQAQISKSGGTETVNGVILQGIGAVGGASFIANNSLDNGNNSGWVISPPISRTYYWVGGSGNWSNPANWSLSSGGATAGCVPSAVDDVIFDSNSFSSGSNVVTVDIATAFCKNMNWSSAGFNPMLASNSTSNLLKVYGSLTLNPTMSLTFNGSLLFESVSAGQTITSAGQVLACEVRFNGVGGEWILQDEFHTTRTLLLNHGTLRTNDQPLTCAQFSSYNTNTRSLYLGTSTITIDGGSHGWFFLAGGLTLDADESYIVLEARTFYGVGGTYDVVEFIDPNERGSVNDENVIIRKLIFGGDGELGCYNSQIDSIITVGNLSYNRYGNSFGYVEVGGNFEIDGYSGNVTDSLFVGGNGLIREGSNSFGLARFQGNLSIDPLGSSTPTSQTFGDCFIGGDGNILSDNQFGKLRLSPGMTYTFSAGNTQTITDSLLATGNSGFPIELLSSSIGLQTNIALGQAVLCADYLFMRDMAAVGSGTYYVGTNSDDISNNTGWIFDTGCECSGSSGADNQAPVPDIAILPDITDECSVTISTSPTATDNCTGAVTATTTDPLTYTSQGTYTITWTYDDGNGNISQQTQTVIVDDITAPVADVAILPDITDECSVTISTSPTATDNCTGAVTATTTDPLTYTSQGTYTITWTYDDGNGNISQQTQTVIVDDITAPVADVAILPDITGECSVTISTSPTATDNCAGSIIGTTTDPLTYTSQGTYTITWTYDDGNGSISQQTQTVIVENTLVADAGPDKAVLINTAGGPAPQPCDTLDGSAFGGTSPYIYSWSPVLGLSDPNIANPEACPSSTTIYTLTVSDINGCVASDDVTVAVTDVNDPGLPTVGNNSNKVYVCHLDNCTTLEVSTTANCSSPSSLCYHLNHGDVLGPCTCRENLSEVSEKISMNIAPNPVTSSAVIDIYVSQNTDAVLTLYSSSGLSIKTLFKGKLIGRSTQSFKYKFDDLASGVYYCQLITPGQSVHKKVMIIH